MLVGVTVTLSGHLTTMSSENPGTNACNNGNVLMLTVGIIVPVNTHCGDVQIYPFGHCLTRGAGKLCSFLGCFQALFTAFTPSANHSVPTCELMVHLPVTQWFLTRIAPRSPTNLLGSSLVVQWLGLCTSTTRDQDPIPGWGTKIPHAEWCRQEKKFFNRIFLFKNFSLVSLPTFTIL